MNREQAQLERDQQAAQHPEATWLVAERHPGEWAVVKVGLAPPGEPEGTATEARPKPDNAEDPRHVNQQTLPPWSAGI